MLNFRNQWPATVLCLSILALTGCSDDDCPTAPTVVIPTMDAAMITTTPDVFYGAASDKSQVFEVLRTGKLMRVEFLVNSLNTDLQFDIRSTASGVPADSNDAVLFSSTVDSAGYTAGYQVVNIPGGLAVTAGDKLAFVLRGDHIGAFRFDGRSTNIYPDGDLYLRTSASNYQTWEPAPFEGDVCFSTWVVPAVD